MPASAHQLMAVTVAEREREFPRSEVLRAREARRLLNIMWFPSEFQIARTLTPGQWLNTKVTAQDVKMARDIYGPDETVLAGKTRDLGPVRPSEVLVPVHMRRDQVAYADIFFWRMEAFVIYILKPMLLLLGRHLPKGTKNAAWPSRWKS